MTPEEEARQLIDELLEAAGWLVQDYKDLNLEAAHRPKTCSTKAVTMGPPLSITFAE